MSTRKTPKDRMSNDRRAFLKRAALGAAATAGLGVLAGCDDGTDTNCPFGMSQLMWHFEQMLF